MSLALTPLVLQNAPLLRRLAEPDRPIETMEGLARDLGRDGSNVRKSLKALTSEGLIVDGWTAVGEIRISEGAENALRALAAAEAAAEGREVPTSAVLCSRAELTFNPLNPRKKIDPVKLAALAESLHATDGPEVPPLVLPPNAQGLRIIYAGERRARALDLLIEQGRWDPNRKFLCKEREPDPALGLLIALIENGPREPLSSFEEAKALAEICERLGWSARRAALETGVCDVRTAQEYLKVFREGGPELIADWEAGKSWEKVRETIRAPKPQTDVEGDAPKPVEISPRLAVTLLELAFAVKVSPALASGYEGYTKLTRYPVSSTGALITLAEMGWVQFRRQGETVFARILSATSPAGEWLKAQGFDADPEGVLDGARIRWLGFAQAHQLLLASAYATPELNLKAASAAAEAAEAEEEPLPLDAPALTVEAEAHEHAEASPPGAPGKDTDALSIWEKAALIELGFKIFTDGTERLGRRWTRIGAHWKSRIPQALINRGMIMLENPPGETGWEAALTLFLPRSWVAQTREDLDEILRRECGLENHVGEGFVTAWLDVEAALKDAAAMEAALDAQAAQAEAARRARDAEEAEDAKLVERANKVFSYGGHAEGWEIADLLKATGLRLPLRAAGAADEAGLGAILDEEDTLVAQVDPECHLTPSGSQALAVAISAALNAYAEHA